MRRISSIPARSISSTTPSINPRARSAAARCSTMATAYSRPACSAGSEQVRKYVLVVDADGTVRQKYVTPGQLDGGLRVIKDGLLDSDRVIVNGLMRARAGIKVKAEQQGAQPAPAAGDQAKAG